MTRTAKYIVIISIFLSGMLVIAVGSRSEAQIVILGETLPVFALTRAVGLLMIFGSIIASLAVYGNSLPLTRPEIEGRVRSRSRHVLPDGETPPRNTADEAAVSDTAKRADRQQVHLRRVSTEARLRVIAAKKREKTRDERPRQKSNAA
jgi:hypothetical protein